MARKVISKDELFAIASNIIQEKGVEACSIRVLSKEAGVAVGTIYNYFPSRKEFLEELFKNSWLITLEKLQPIPKMEKPAKEKLEMFAYTLQKDILARKGLGRELYGVAKSPRDMCESHKKFFGDIINVIQNIISGSDKNVSCEPNELSMVSKWIFMVIIDSIVGKEFPLENVVQELIKRFI